MAHPECLQRRWVHSWFPIWYWGGQTAFCQTHGLVPYSTELFYSCIISYTSLTATLHLNCDSLQIGIKQCWILQEYEKHCQKLRMKKLTYLPTKSSAAEHLCHADGCVLRVYTDIPQVEEYLTRPEFILSMCRSPLLDCRKDSYI